MFLMERVLVKFTKINEAKFISHLDTMRTLHRALRRAGIPIAYSQGFNPHASISVAAPLSLGITSTAEYADIELNELIEGELIKEKLNKVLPEGIRILDVLNITEKMPSSMGIVEGAKYLIKMQHNTSEENIQKITAEVMNLSEIFMNKRTKSGEKLVDIKPLIEDIKVLSCDNSQVIMECLLHTGSRGSLGPEMIADLLKERSKGSISGYPDIERIEIFSKANNNWISLSAYFSGK